MGSLIHNTRRILPSLCLAAAFGAATATASAAIVEDNFNSLDDNAAFPPVGSAWTKEGNNNGVTMKSFTAAESPFTAADPGRGITQTDTNSNTTNAGASAGVRQEFAATTDALVISLDFRINDSGTNDTVPTIFVGSAEGSTTGLYLNLSRNVSGSLQMTYQAGSTGTYLQDISLDTWYHVVIETTAADDPGGDKFTVTVTPFGGASTVHSDLGFRTGVTHFDRVRIFNNGSNASTGSFSYDNVSVAIPEPASMGMLLGPVSALLLMRRGGR